MIYTDAGKYALRALMHLAEAEAESRPPGARTAADIAGAEGIPPFYLAKVLKELANAGILDSVRGRNGGFRLARAAEDITVLSVLECTEDLRRRLERCVLGLDGCSADAPCGLHFYWSRFREEAVRRLADMSIADLRSERDRKRPAP